MVDLMNVIANNGVAVGVVIYLIYFQNTTMKEMNNTQTKICSTLESMNKRLDDIEDKINAG